MSSAHPTEKTPMQEGINDVLPLLLGYLPCSMAYGLLAKQCGISLAATLAMSMVVYAGTAQLVAVAMIQSGQTMGAIVLSTAVINLRYLLINGALSEHMRGWKLPHRLLLSYWVSDETFVVMSGRATKEKLNRTYALTVNMVAVLWWTLCSFLGYSVGAFIPDLKKFGLDYALAAVLIALATLMTKSKKFFLVGVLSGLLSVLFFKLGFLKLNVLTAALVASILGMVHTWKTKSR